MCSFIHPKTIQLAVYVEGVVDHVATIDFSARQIFNLMPIQRMQGTAILFPMDLYRGPSAAGLPRIGISV
jgi:hypothetical protein